MDNTKISWKDLLIKNGLNNDIVKSFIGFISWKPDNIYPKLGNEITDVLTGYSGRIIAKDVYCEKYKSYGIIFLNKEISDVVAQKIHDIIISYENEEVYN